MLKPGRSVARNDELEIGENKGDAEVAPVGFVRPLPDILAAKGEVVAVCGTGRCCVHSD